MKYFTLPLIPSHQGRGEKNIIPSVEEPRHKWLGFSSARNFIVDIARLDSPLKGQECDEHSVQGKDEILIPSPLAPDRFNRGLAGEG